MDAVVVWRLVQQKQSELLRKAERRRLFEDKSVYETSADSPRLQVGAGCRGAGNVLRAGVRIEEKGEMLNRQDILVRQEQCKDLRRAAQRERLARHALAGREARRHPHSRALAWLGGRLIDWGCRLQTRYGDVASAAHALVGNLDCGQESL